MRAHHPGLSTRGQRAFLGAFAAGSLAGVVIMSLLLGSASQRADREEKAAAGSGEELAAGAAPGGSRLGVDANLPAFAREQRALVAETQARSARLARSWTQEQRLDYITRRIGEADLLGWPHVSRYVLELQLELGATLLPEDLPAALQRLAKFTGRGIESESHLFFQRLIEHVAAASPEVDFVKMVREGPPELREDMMNAALQLAGARDPFAALELLKQPENIALADNYDLTNCFALAAKEDAPRAMRAAGALPGLDNRATAYGAVANAIAQTKGLRAALDLLESVPEAGMRAKAQMQLMNAAGDDPSLIDEFFEVALDRNISSRARRFALGMMLDRWEGSAESSEKALDWLDQNAMGLDFGLSDHSWGRPYTHLAAKEPQRALQRAMKESGTRREAAIDGIFEAILWKGTEPALAAMEGLTGSDLEIARPKLLESWALKEPAEALAYLEGLGEFSGRAKSVEALVKSWSRTSMADASAWADQLPAGPEREAAAKSLAQNIIYQRGDTGDAVAWALQISDPKERNVVLQDCIRHVSSAEVARAALQKHADVLSPQVIEEIMRFRP